MSDVTLITATADQPLGISLCERWMQQQTVWGSTSIQWLVADDGEVPATLTLGQIHVRRDRVPQESGAQSLCRNLLAAIPLVESPYVVIIEHDDYYRSDHLERMLDRLSKGAGLAGPVGLYYFNLEHRCWHHASNAGITALYQTGFRAELLPTLRNAARECHRRNDKGVDGKFWRLTADVRKKTYQDMTAVGIKGLPGRSGIGVGHAPDHRWARDPELLKLAEWVGVDNAAEYRRVTALPIPNVGWAMRTADRSLRKGKNYVGRTIRQLFEQGPVRVHLQATNPDISWLSPQLDGIESSVVLHVPDSRLYPNEAGWCAIEHALQDPMMYDWVVLLEDDLDFCADFTGSVGRWLARFGRAGRSVFRFFGFERPTDRRVRDVLWMLGCQRRRPWLCVVRMQQTL